MKILLLLLIFSGCTLNPTHLKHYNCWYVQDEHSKWKMVCVEPDDEIDEVTEE